MLIFIEDKDIEYVQAMSLFAKENNIEFMHIVDGIKGARFIRHNLDQIDVVIVDYFLPNMRGDILIQKIRRDFHFSRSIYLTSISDKVLIQNNSILDINGILGKVNPTHFVESYKSYVFKTGSFLIGTDYILRSDIGVLLHKFDSNKFVVLSDLEIKLLQMFTKAAGIRMGSIWTYIPSCSVAYRLNYKFKKNNFALKFMCRRGRLFLKKL